MLLEKQRDSALQAGLRIGVGGQNAGIGVGEGAGLDGLSDDGADPGPCARHISNNHKNIGRKPRDQHGNAGPKVMGHSIQRPGSPFIALLCQVQKIGKRHRCADFPAIGFSVARRG